MAYHWPQKARFALAVLNISNARWFVDSTEETGILILTMFMKYYMFTYT